MSTPHRYSKDEYVAMVITYWESNSDAEEARTKYSEKFPERFLPPQTEFEEVISRLKTTGSVFPDRGSAGIYPRLMSRLECRESILESIEEERELHGDPDPEDPDEDYTKGRYHVERMDSFEAADLPPRRKFCKWLLGRQEQDPDFTKNVFVTDVVCFTESGIFNFDNSYFWSVVDPNASTESLKDKEQEFAVNMWAGMINDTLIGPYELPPRLSHKEYLKFIDKVLTEVMDELPLEVRNDMWFLSDTAAAHRHADVNAYLNKKFPGRWIGGRKAAVLWPARSWDLHPVDYFLWPELRYKVYTTDVKDIADLRERIKAAGEATRAKPQILGMIRGNWIGKAVRCLRANGGCFKYVF